MNEVIKSILTRRSTRDFNDELVKKSDIEMILKTAIYAPSGQNRQTGKYIAIMNQDLILELAKIIEEVLERKAYNFYKAKVLILTTNQKESIWGRDDCACAMQNMMLAAHSLDIGSVWINQVYQSCENPKMRALLDKIGVPSDYIVYGVCALGYSDSTPLGIISKKENISIIE